MKNITNAVFLALPAIIDYLLLLSFPFKFGITNIFQKSTDSFKRWQASYEGTVRVICAIFLIKKIFLISMSNSLKYHVFRVWVQLLFITNYTKYKNAETLKSITLVSMKTQYDTSTVLLESLSGKSFRTKNPVLLKHTVWYCSQKWFPLGLLLVFQFCGLMLLGF